MDWKKIDNKTIIGLMQSVDKDMESFHESRTKCPVCGKILRYKDNQFTCGTKDCIKLTFRGI